LIDSGRLLTVPDSARRSPNLEEVLITSDDALFHVKGESYAGRSRLPLSSGQFVVFFAAEALGVDEGSVADLLVPIRQESSISEAINHPPELYTSAI
jgi:hypothetical protein